MSLTPFFMQMSTFEKDEYVNDWVDFLIKLQTTRYANEEHVSGKFILKRVIMVLTLKK